MSVAAAARQPVVLETTTGPPQRARLCGHPPTHHGRGRWCTAGSSGALDPGLVLPVPDGKATAVSMAYPSSGWRSARVRPGEGTRRSSIVVTQAVRLVSTGAIERRHDARSRNGPPSLPSGDGGGCDVAAGLGRARRRASPSRRETAGCSRVTAWEALAALRTGDLKATHYAGVLLGRARSLGYLNTVLAQDPHLVLAVAQAADQRRPAARRLGRSTACPS